MTGRVMFSLDFELGWGHTHVRPEYVRKLRSESNEEFNRIRSLIDIFDEYEVAATWAVVGKLTEPGDDPMYHNPEIFEYLLQADVSHDIGLHSYEHRSFTDISREEAQIDVSAGVNALASWGIHPKSFIYPRGQIEHRRVLEDHGFKCYRSKLSQSKFQSFLQELVPPVISHVQSDDALNPVPATYYLAARRPDELIRLNLQRSLKRVVRNGGLVHFWLHPHNIYTRPTLFDIIKEGLASIRRYSDGGQIDCVTMDDVTR